MHNATKSKSQTFDLGVGFRKKEEFVRHGQLSLKQWRDLQSSGRVGEKIVAMGVLHPWE